ncbi:MAG: hypothetical protein K9M51_04125 [Candidatus Gracilibacteria bacterium]|nr:hypothetical protein [Candidatus Gracilibacteria bacterium]
MIKIVNRLLILVIIIGGIWFLAENWNSDEEIPVNEPTAEEMAEEANEEESAEDIEDLKNEIVENIPDYTETEGNEENASPEEEEPTASPEPTPAPEPATPTPQPTPEPPAETEPVLVVPNVQTDVRVYLYEWEIDLTDRVLPAGTVTFEVINSGRFTHAFAIEGVGDFGKVLPGARETFVVDLSPGIYQVLSPREVDLHYDMNENIVVEEQ